MAFFLKLIPYLDYGHEKETLYRLVQSQFIEYINETFRKHLEAITCSNDTYYTYDILL